MCTSIVTNAIDSVGRFVGDAVKGAVKAVSPEAPRMPERAPEAPAGSELAQSIKPMANPANLIRDARGNLVRRRNARSSLRIDLATPGSASPAAGGPPTIGV